MFSVFAPTTFAIRSAGTSDQFRHTKAYKRFGNHGKETGFGAEPTGSEFVAFVDHGNNGNTAPAAAIHRNFRRLIMSENLAWAGKY